MSEEELEKEAEGRYCKGCKWRIDQCLWAWRKTNGLKEPNEKNCSCKEVPAYLAGAEPREKRIEELEEKISVLLSCKNCPENKGGLLCQKEYEDKCLAQKIEFIKELQKENAGLKCECRRCVYSDSPCILSDYGKDKKGICDHFKDVFDEVVELNDELKEWKDEWQEQVQKATDEGYARTLQTIQLTKAKEIIKNLLSAYTSYADSFDDRDNEIVEEAGQFISEVEK